MVSGHARQPLAVARFWPVGAPVAASASRPETPSHITGQPIVTAHRDLLDINRIDRRVRYTHVQTLRQRREFLRIRGGSRWSSAAFVIETRRRPNEDAQTPDKPRIGYTVTKRIGNAVVRNRIKRRFRAAAASLRCGELRPGYDYVLIARSGALKRPFVDLTNDLREGLTHIHRPKRKGRATKLG